MEWESSQSALVHFFSFGSVSVGGARFIRGSIFIFVAGFLAGAVRIGFIGVFRSGDNGVIRLVGSVNIFTSASFARISTIGSGSSSNDSSELDELEPDDELDSLRLNGLLLP